MHAGIRAFAIALAALSACREAPKHETPARSQDAGKTMPQEEASPPIPPPGTGPDARTPFARTDASIDPKSARAAEEVVRQFGSLVEQERYAEAEELWNNRQSAAAFMKKLNSSMHLEVGDAGATEGAAGSIYTSVPALFFFETFSRPAVVILRRVNDVPGSTAAQRRWHIERIDWKDSD